MDILEPQQSIMIAIGYALQAVFGTSTIVVGFACTPDGSNGVNIGPGGVTSYTVVDSTAYGSVAANSNPLVKMGISNGTTNFQTTPPPLSGQTAWYLVQASFSEVDGDSIVLPYVNSANPAQPFAGPNNAGTPNNLYRYQQAAINLKVNNSSSGTPNYPTADSGYVPLWNIAVPYGTTVVSSGDITVNASAPFANTAASSPGVSHLVTYSIGQTGSSWTAPDGVTKIKLRMWGGGGGGGSGGGTGGVGGGGAGAGYFEGFASVTPGQSYLVTIGAGGTSGSNGGDTSLGSIATAIHGGAGGSGGGAGAGTGSTFPGTPTVGSAVTGAPLVQPGSGGSNGIVAGTVFISGAGGGCGTGIGATSASGSSTANVTGNAVNNPGAGGSGGLGTGSGGAGASGQLIIEY